MNPDSFKKVELEDADELKNHYLRFPVEHSDYMHSTMMAWSHYMDYYYSWIDDSLVIMTELENRKRIRPPVGEFSESTFSKVIHMAGRNGLEPMVSMIGQRTHEWMREKFPDLEYLSHRDYFEYVYRSDDLADLPGKRYLKVRNYLNKFRRENSYQVEPIDQGNIEEVIQFLRRWCVKKGCDEDPFLLSERQANMYALEHMDDLGLAGITIRVGDQLEALSIHESMSDDTVVIHYEKANFDIQGLYQAINNEAALILRDRYDFINREADMGVKGLRKAKKKYGPHHMMEVFHARID